MPRDEAHHLNLHQVAAMAREAMLRDGFHQPTVIAQGDRAPVIAQLPDLPPDQLAKSARLFEVGLVIARERLQNILQQVYFICEAWLVMLATDHDLDVRPSEHPQRLEVLIVSSLDLVEQISGIVIFEILREADKLVELRDYPPAHDTQAQSPLLEAIALGFLAGQQDGT